MFRKLISKSNVVWLLLTAVATLFSMAAVSTSIGFFRYFYCLTALGSCYGIRLMGRREGGTVKDAR